MSLNVGDQEYNGGKKYRQKGTLCGPNSVAIGKYCQLFWDMHPLPLIITDYFILH
jgi:hypothetical protein